MDLNDRVREMVRDIDMAQHEAQCEEALEDYF